MANNLTAERWQKIKELFHAALERDLPERAPFLDQACAGDAELRREVESLLAAHNEPDSFIDKAAIEVAADLLAADDPPPAIDRIIGPYKITHQIGRGGMGEVYLAQDTRLGRRVALKMLPSRFTTDGDRLRRFKQEARAASALNHPNIITIHEVGQIDGTQFIATEFVEGRTLRSAIDEGEMKAGEALDVAIQVASALRAAHEAGIVHRDIKPENIMLRPDGYVKVLDFGLAKLVERNAMTGDTGASFTAVDTNPGVVMGTVSYMSPEQTRGLAMDARTDIFSLGVVLYEMIAGRVPFEGKTVSDVIVAILEKEPPPLSTYSNGAPAGLEAIIEKALQKKKEDRYQTAGELLEELRGLKQNLEIQARIESGSGGELLAGARKKASGEQPSAASGAAITATNAANITGKIKPHKKPALIISAALGLLAAVLFWMYMAMWKSNPPAPFQAMQITRVNTPRKALEAAISPDGKHVAYLTGDADRQAIWLKQLATNTDTQMLPPDEAGYKWLTYSPDGNYLYFIASKKNEPRTLHQIPATGGPVRKLAVRVTTSFSLSPDGKRIAFVRSSGDGESAVIVADVEGSGEQKIASRKLPEWFSGTAWSPDGKVIVCGAGNSESDVNIHMTVVEVRIEDETIRPITTTKWQAVQKVSWLRDGSGLIVVGTERLSRDRAQLWLLSYPTGEARRITNDLTYYSGNHLSLTADSSAILTLKSDTISNIWVAPDSARNNTKQISFGPAGTRDGTFGLSWTPDGKLLYSSYVYNNQAIFKMNADGTEPRQLTSGDWIDARPTTALNGRYITFHSTRGGKFNIWRIDIDGNNPKQLTYTTRDAHPYCSPDGKWVFYASSYEGKEMLYKMPIDGGQPMLIFDKPCAYPAVSPDGKLIALPYVDEQVKARRVGIISSETGQLLRSFDLDSYWNLPRWTPDGRAVAYIKTEGDVSNIWAQPLDGGKAVRLTDFKSDLIFNFAWSFDGKQLAVARGSDSSDVVLIRDIG